MSRHGEAAVAATRLVVARQLSPRDAWSKAIAEQPGGYDKNCPRTTYLTLCGEGFIRGVPPGRYAQGRENATYAIALVRLLIEDGSRVDEPEAVLWKLVGAGDTHRNGQVEVVKALWRAGLILANPPS